jgi:transcriptional regulator with AAA-type ATPase domain
MGTSGRSPLISCRDSTTSPTPQSEGSRRVDFKDSDSFNHVVKAIRLRLPCGIAAGNSVIVLGEAGTGKSDFALALHEEMSGEFNSAIATYKGSIKKFFMAIAIIIVLVRLKT